MRIAVVGAGVSGLTAAYRLQARHQVTVFEANGYAGGHTNTICVNFAGEQHAIDTGFIVFNERNYPNFCQLMAELGVTSHPTTMSFSVRDDSTGLEYNGSSLNTLFAQRRNVLRPTFLRMLADILRFQREAVALAAMCPERTSVREFLAMHGYSPSFAEQYLLPMGSAIWSCPIGRFEEFPIRFLVEFFANHGLLQVRNRPTWRVIEGGSQMYVRELLRRFENPVRLRSPVARIRRSLDRVEVQTSNGDVASFDHVVLACHSDQALRMLGPDATAVEHEVLSAFPYERNLAVLHTDETVLPRRRRAWASWNYRLVDRNHPASVTYNMNLLQGIHSRHTFCVTLNSPSPIAEERILGTYEYSHPVFDVRRTAAQSRHWELLNSNRSSFCGAYWGNGFHEDGVNSAIAVVSALEQAEPGSRAMPTRYADNPTDRSVSARCNVT